MEKCGNLWQPKHGAADRREGHGALYAIQGAGRTHEMGACSACAGDYEDPDRTAWTPDDLEDEERGVAPRATPDEFPAEE